MVLCVLIYNANNINHTDGVFSKNIEANIHQKIRKRPNLGIATEQENVNFLTWI